MYHEHTTSQVQTGEILQDPNESWFLLQMNYTGLKREKQRGIYIVKNT